MFFFQLVQTSCAHRSYRFIFTTLIYYCCSSAHLCLKIVLAKVACRKRPLVRPEVRWRLGDLDLAPIDGPMAIGRPWEVAVFPLLESTVVQPTCHWVAAPMIRLVQHQDTVHPWQGDNEVEGPDDEVKEALLKPGPAPDLFNDLLQLQHVVQTVSDRKEQTFNTECLLCTGLREMCNAHSCKEQCEIRINHCNAISLLHFFSSNNWIVSIRHFHKCVEFFLVMVKICQFSLIF